jgi:phage antirepressor YoqD-like protein
MSAEPTHALAIRQEPERINGWAIVREDDVALVRDLEIAERAGLAQPRNIRAVIEANRAEIEAFGPLRTRRVLNEISAGFGVRIVEVDEFWLTEEQAYAVTIHLRTPKASQLRIDLVKLYTAFRRGEFVMEAPPPPPPAPMLPQTYLEALKQLVVAEEERQVLALQVEEMRPAHDFGNLVGKTTNALPMAEVAKIFGIGPRKFFDKLRDLGIIQKKPSRVPYQEHLDAERFIVREGTHSTNTRGEQAHAVTRVTAKGQQYLAVRLGLIPPPANDQHLLAGGDK